MPQTNETRRAVSAAGLGNVDLRAAKDVQESTSSPSNKQAHSRVRRQYLVGRVHELGPSPLFHFISDVERGGDVAELLEQYAALPADFIRSLGGDRFAPSVHKIGSAA